MDKGAEERRAETKRCQNAQKENDVSRRSKENCRSPKAEMGEGKNRPKEVGVRDPSGQNGDVSHGRNVNGVVAR